MKTMKREIKNYKQRQEELCCLLKIKLLQKFNLNHFPTRNSNLYATSTRLNPIAYYRVLTLLSAIYKLH